MLKALTDPISIPPSLTGSIQVVYESKKGAVRTLKTEDPKRLQELWTDHLRGKARAGCSPATRDGLASWCAWDLDAHGPNDPDRMEDALTLADALYGLGMPAYVERSRHGRGAHVFCFLAAPVQAEALEALAREVAETFSKAHPGGLDYFPHGQGALFLPGFGGACLLDRWGFPVPWDSLEKVPLETIAGFLPAPTRLSKAAQTWRPRHWRGSNGRAPQPKIVTDPMLAGLLFKGPDGLYHARRGARNRLAGSTARHLLRTGGAFTDFARWDETNLPPMATDKPDALTSWWSWATHKQKGA